jgi:alpha-1,2-mannosyltransferase
VETRTRAALRWSVLALLVVGVGAAHLWYGNRHQFFDLGIYVEALDWWFAGHDLYTFGRLDLTQGSLGFTYPPFGALVLAPFALLPWGAATGLYSALAAAAYAVTTYWLVAPVARRHGWSVWWAVALALVVVSALEPIRETVTFGQINPLLIVLILGDLLFLVPRKSRWAGVLIGIAAAIKLTPAIFVVYLLISGRRQAALTSIASAATVTLLAAAVAPRASWAFWTEVLWRGEGLGRSNYTPNQSIMGLLSRLWRPDAPSTLLWAVLVASVLGYGLWRARRAALAGDELVGLTLTGLVGSLASPVTWAHHLYWFVPALVVLVDVAATRADRRAIWSGILATVVTLTVCLGMISWFELGLPEDPWDSGLSGFLIRNWYLLLVALLLAVLPIRSRSEAADPIESSGSPAGTLATVR